MSEPPPVPEEFVPVFVEPAARRSTWWIWPVLVFMIALNIGLFILSSRVNDKDIQQELVTLAGSGLEVLPFLPLIVLAQAGNTSPNSRALAFGYWILFSLVALLTAALFTFSGVYDFALAEQLPPEKAMDAIRPGGLSKSAQVLGIGFAGLVLGFIAFTCAGRAVATRFIPIEPSCFTCAIALSTAIVLLTICIGPLLILREPPILAMIQAMKDSKYAEAFTVDSSVRSLYYRLVWIIPVVVIAAGFPLTRRNKAAIAHLGLGGLSMGQFIVASWIAIALLSVMVGIEPRIQELWKKWGWPTTDAHGLEELFKFAVSHSGALAVGITAGISEELAFRGLLQPRIGLLLSNILFTAVHAFQYNWDALLLVFVIGFICGLVRKYSNTTAAVIVHGLYDTLAVLLMVLQKQAQ